jgi:hypothetical protein
MLEQNYNSFKIWLKFFKKLIYEVLRVQNSFYCEYGLIFKLNRSTNKCENSIWHNQQNHNYPRRSSEYDMKNRIYI